MTNDMKLVIQNLKETNKLEALRALWRVIHESDKTKKTENIKILTSAGKKLK